MAVAAGNNQSALAGTSLAERVTFRLLDALGNGVPNATVTFIVTAGEGSLVNASSAATTDDTGSATAPSWTLGKLAVPQQLTATAGTLSATATATVNTQYHAELRFFGGPIDPKYLSAFTRAIDRLNAEVIGSVTPVSFTNEDVASACGAPGVSPLNEQIGSLVIFAGVGTIDGVGGVIAASGPCYVRQTDKLTVVGTMLFDAADLPGIFGNGQLNDLVFHEMQHVLGFGTLWTTVSPVLIVNGGTPQTAFTGSAGIRGCQQGGGVSFDCLPAIPLESGGGPGSADQHWRWSIFGTELMTAILPPPGTPKILSAMTIGSIADLGYQTNINVADSYVIPSAVAAAYAKVRQMLNSDTRELRDVVVMPRYLIAGSGEVSVLK